MMLCIDRQETDPYFNIAAEEYFLKNFEEDIFMVWCNTRSVIIGKHQDPLIEINYHYVNRQNIPVIRRISGGGTVFHDLGNLNFTFIFTGKRESLVNYRKYTSPIIQFLKSQSIEAEFVAKSDLKIKGLKFSGNAEHVYKNRVLHHGTLLYSSNLKELGKVLNPEKNLQANKKFIRSNPSPVTNISDHLTKDMDIYEFKNILFDYIMKFFNNTTTYDLKIEDIYQIESLVRDKYAKQEWNYGRI